MAFDATHIFHNSLQMYYINNSVLISKTHFLHDNFCLLFSYFIAAWVHTVTLKIKFISTKISLDTKSKNTLQVQDHETNRNTMKPLTSNRDLYNPRTFSSINCRYDSNGVVGIRCQTIKCLVQGLSNWYQCLQRKSYLNGVDYQKRHKISRLVQQFHQNRFDTPQQCHFAQVSAL